MASLQVLHEKWVEKFAEMQKLFRGQLVTPHLTVPPDGYNPKRIPSVLFVGQATGPNEAEEGNPSAEEIRDKIGAFQRDAALRPHPRSGFWRFALCLSDALKRQTGHADIAPLQNLVWTNICKIGVRRGNPPKQIYEFQRELAIHTLRAEIASYKPKLVYWATWDYLVDVVREAVDDPNDISWTKDLEDKWIWTRRPVNSLPAMVWSGRPQGKPRTDRTYGGAEKLCERRQVASRQVRIVRAQDGLQLLSRQ